MATKKTTTTKAAKTTVKAPATQVVMSTPSTSMSMPLPQNMMVVLGIGLVLGFVLGHLWTRVDLLEKGGSAGTGAAPTEQGAAAPQPAKELSITKPDPKKDHWMGPEDAKFVHVEYSDFECPFCGSYAPTMKQLKDEYGDKMAFVYRHFPLSFHPLAQPTAEASECVAELGGNTAFWKFHDIMFAKMPNVTVAGLGDFALEAGVNKASFQTCYDAGKHKAKVQAQFDEGSKAGVGATPTSVIYNMKTGKSHAIEGALPFEQAKQIVEKAMNE
jgi:protein-disulfide isomerase